MQSPEKIHLKDRLDRRRRNAPRQPSPDPRVLNSTHLKLLQFIHLFGGFSTVELVYRYAKHLGITGSNYSTYISGEINDVLFHDHGLVEKPEEQFAVKNPYGNGLHHGIPLVYKVTPKGIEELKRADLFNESAPKAHGWYKHQMMTALMYQIFYLSALEKGIPFTPQHELKIKQEYITLFSETKVRPDAVFVIELNQPALIFFELDRGTEKGNDHTIRKTWGKSIEYYKRIFNEKQYRQMVDVADPHRAFLVGVTTCGIMHSKIQRSIEAVYPGGCSNILTTVTRAFGPTAKDFYPARYFNILETRWNRFSYPPVVFAKST